MKYRVVSCADQGVKVLDEMVESDNERVALEMAVAMLRPHADRGECFSIFEPGVGIFDYVLDAGETMRDLYEVLDPTPDEPDGRECHHLDWYDATHCWPGED